jgi:cytochrome c556
MKKIVAALAIGTMIVTSLEAAAPQKDPRMELMREMRTMMDAMEQIQRGGLYSSTEDMKLGVKKLQGTLASLESEDVKSILPKDQAYAYKFAQKSAHMLRMYSDDLVYSIDAGKMDNALDSYTQLLKQCTSCHIRIRNW